MDDRQNARWAIDLICCGREDGTQTIEGPWSEADAFRESYCNAPGHERQGIVRRASPDDGDPGWHGTGLHYIARPGVTGVEDSLRRASLLGGNAT